MDEPRALNHSASRLLLCLLIPLAAFAVQWIFWAAIHPYVWFFFFPAVFFSSWIGGLPGGLAATLLSTLLVVYFFISPQLSFAITKPVQFISIGMFMGMGALFSWTHDRLRKANQKAADALAEAREAKEKVTELYRKTLELDELKTQFFANVSHELRTPLTLILPPLDKLLGLHALPEKCRGELETARMNARLLLHQVNDLLDVAKLEAGRMEPRYAVTDLARLCRVTASHYESLARDRGDRFTVDAPDELPAQLDAEMIQRVLLNLLSNAFKFTPPGGVIKLALVRDGDNAVIRVLDNGPGVAPVMREAVFERFRQVEGHAERRFGGTGLGLAIAREFMELHGGTITLDETPGGGARFTLSLPIAAPAGNVIHPAPAPDAGKEFPHMAPEPAAPRPQDTGVPACRLDAGEGLVLVVEDNPDMNDFISRALGERFAVHRAFDGEEGLAKALEHAPDLIVTDVMMPRMSGDRMVRELRGHAELEDVPVLVLTAKADDALRLDMLKAGVRDYIIKPFSTQEVMAKAAGLVAASRRDKARQMENRRRFQATFERAAVGIAHVSTDGRCLMVNQRLCEMLGRPREEIVGRKSWSLIHPDDQETVQNLRGQVLAGDIASGHVQMRRLQPDGSSLWTDLTVSLVLDAEERPDYFICVLEDIQFRKDAEDKIRRSLAEKETLLREVHHRVKNNLQVIMSLISLQFEDASDRAERDRARILRGRIKSMALVHERLYRAGDLGAVDFPGYIQDVVNYAAGTFRREAGSVDVRVEAAPLALSIDKAVPCGLLLNELISNAFTHAFAGGRGGRLDVTLVRQDGRAVLAVADDGPGFPPGFDLARPATLGFQLVAELVKQLHGEARLPDLPGMSGARVEVSFPCADAGAETAEGNSAAPPTGEG